MNRSSIITIISAALSLCACTQRGSWHDTLIYPDYTDITVPCNIAPLNFHYTEPAARNASTTFVAGDYTLVKKGREVVFSEKEWSRLMKEALGSEIKVSSSLCDEDWSINVSRDSIDSYLTYRLIEPGYEVWQQVEIRERNISNFEEKAISDWQHTDNACMNCHVHTQGRGDLSIFYVRGKNGGAFLNRNGAIRKLNLRNGFMASGTVYGELHPSGRYGVFSTNVIIPGFHSLSLGRLEVYDTESDLVVVDFDKNTIFQSPEFAREDKFETFPVFSADGDYVYYCDADTVSLPQNVDKLMYSLKRVDFDSERGRMGKDVVTVWDAAATGLSVCHPKCSPDGRWLVFTVAEYGTFPIWHRECDLKIMDLATGEVRDMTAANSDRSDSYHSWSSSSRWLVFASKRGDGQYGKPYFCHIDSTGTASKAFVLPQADPYMYEEFTRSFNIPDLGNASVGFDAATIGEMVHNLDSEIFE